MFKWIVFAVALSVSQNAWADEILVAAASDLSFPMKEIIAGFQKKTGHTVKLTLGSSGNFQTQITNGAPFDIFMSADIDYINQLDRLKFVEPGSLLVYAVGRIVVWVPNRSTIDIGRLGINALVHESAKRVAIANPAHAPYGRAAVSAMEYFKVYERVKPHLVMGENVAQAAQFVSSGAADIGIVALSLAMADPMHSSGRYWEIPPDAYPRIEQGLGILSHARKAGHLDAAYAFRNWIASTDSMVIFAKYGLFPPGKP